jgi:hypothetical protein
MIFSCVFLAASGLQPAPPDQALNLVGVPLIGGDSDLGLVLGLMGIITRPRDEDDFVWQLQLMTGTSIKSDGATSTWPLQRHFLRFEKPRFWKHLDLWLEARFERVIDAGYFGLESGSASEPAAAPQTDYYQYQTTEPHLRGYLTKRFGRRKLTRIYAGIDAKYASAVAPPGSLLDRDALSQPRLLGLAPHATLQPWFGLAFNNYDRRFSPTQGSNHLITLRGATGLLSPDLQFAGLSLLLQQYFRAGPKRVVAYRIWLDALFGKVPFEELARGGDLRQTRMLGHSRSLRGLPWGRVHAPYKALATVKLRQTLRRFARPNKPPIVLDLTVFAEAGRGWWRFDEGFMPAWSVGGGPRLTLAPGVIIRVDAAYAPAAASLSEGFLTGFYIDLGEVF